MRIAVACRTACFRGLIRRLDIEIGFDPCMAAQSAAFLIDRIPKALGFRRFRMGADCVRLPDCLFPWIGSRIGRRNRIRYEGNTGISVCLAARPADFNRRTVVFRWFRLCAGGDCLSQASPSWTDSGIRVRDWVWSDFGAVAGLAAGWSWSGNRGIQPFLDEYGLRPSAGPPVSVG